MGLPVKTYSDIMACKPCYDPVERGLCTRDWRGTALDVLRAAGVSAQDKLWLILRRGWIDDRTLRLFACWCARQALALVDNPDPCSVKPVEVAERYAYGKATYNELAAARAAAETAWAAKDAAWAAAWAAAIATVWDAAWAAKEAAWAAAIAAAGAVAGDAIDAAGEATWEAAKTAAQDAQAAELERRLAALLDTASGRRAQETLCRQATAAETE